MKYTIHEDPQLSHSSYENSPVFTDGDIVELITVDGSSHLFMVRKTAEEGSNCKYCEAHKVTSCLNYWFACIDTHLKQLDKVLEEL